MRRSFLMVAVLACAPSAAVAQLGGRGVEVSAGYSTWKNVEGFDGGPSFQVTLFGEPQRGVEIGATGALSIVGLQGTDNTAREWGLGVTFRKPAGAPDRVHPFMDLYAGWSQIRADVVSPGLVIRESGFSVGPGLGLELPAGAVALVLVGNVRWHSYGNIAVGHGFSLGVDGGAGWRYGGKLGVRFGR